MSATAPMPALLDQAARDAFTRELHQSYCVSAGAGVGKTTAIVERIANLALIRRREERDVLARLVVVTYGKLAAEELRVRTRDLLLMQLDPGAIGRQTLLADLRSAFFGTIHSFCLKLIRDQGRFLGLPEDIELLEGKASDALWERFCQSNDCAKLVLPPALMDRVGRHSTFDEILSLARKLAPHEVDRQLGFDPDAPPPALDFGEALGDDGGKSRAKTREHQLHLRRWIEDFQSSASFLQLPNYKGGSRTFLASVANTFRPYAEWLNLAASALAAEIARAYRQYRLEEGLMTYRDQVYWCGELLRNAGVLRRLRQRGYLVILDEAQDTDAEMFSILAEITRPVDAGFEEWPGDLTVAGPENGRFCFVGDDQQSIYGDRADLQVYRQYVDAYRAGSGGQHLEFSVTMRCPLRVIQATNVIFTGGRLSQPFVEFRTLNPRPNCPDGEAWRLALEAPGDNRGRLSDDDCLDRECSAIAGFINVRGRAGLGISKWSDVAVICPRVGWLEAAERIFAKHGLPGVLLSQKTRASVLARYSWPAALFHVLLHPWDRFELIGVLRELFAVSDVDMARLHRAGNGASESGLQFWPVVPLERLRSIRQIRTPRLEAALQLLHDLHRALPGSVTIEKDSPPPTVTLSRYVDLVLERTLLGARLEAIGEPGEETLRRLRLQALRAECDGKTVRAWVNSLVSLLDDPMPAQPGGLDAIQFLTALKAKGLEWPVVIPLGLGREIKPRSEQYPRIERFEGRTQVHFSNVSVDSAQQTRRDERQAEEYQRMLYVTLTRAKRVLIIPDGSLLYGGRNPNMLGLAKWSLLDPDALFAAAPSGQALPPLALDPSGPQGLPKPFNDQPVRLALAAKLSHQIPARVLPSSLVHGQPDGASVDENGLQEEDAQSHDEADFEPPAGVGGVDYGNWWHMVMERYPWGAQDEPQRARYLDSKRADIPRAAEWRDRAVDELARFIASEAHADFLRYGHAFIPEMPFAYPERADRWIEGIMDLVITCRDDAELWVIDWKTDRRWQTDLSEDAFLERLAAKYAPQLQAYAAVFNQGLKRPVSRLLIYATAAARVVEVPELP